MLCLRFLYKNATSVSASASHTTDCRDSLPNKHGGITRLTYVYRKTGEYFYFSIKILAVCCVEKRDKAWVSAKSWVPLLRGWKREGSSTNRRRSGSRSKETGSNQSAGLLGRMAAVARLASSRDAQSNFYTAVWRPALDCGSSKMGGVCSL